MILRLLQSIHAASDNDASHSVDAGHNQAASTLTPSRQSLAACISLWNWLAYFMRAVRWLIGVRSNDDFELLNWQWLKLIFLNLLRCVVYCRIQRCWNQLVFLPSKSTINYWKCNHSAGKWEIKLNIDRSKSKRSFKFHKQSNGNSRKLPSFLLLMRSAISL